MQLKQIFSWWPIVGVLVGSGALIYGILLLPGVSEGQLSQDLDAVSEKPVILKSSDEHQQESVEESERTVDVSGAVVEPGVYKISAGGLVVDAIAAAGGFSESADARVVAEQINLAAPVTQYQKIFIPDRESTDGVVREQDVTSEGLLSINTASQTELESLSGIGEKRAEAIIAARPFSTLSEMVERSVIPESVFADIEKQLML